MWFTDMLYYLHVWYVQSEVLYMLSSSHSKSQLSDSIPHRLFFSFYMNLTGCHTKNIMHSFIIKYFKTTDHTHHNHHLGITTVTLAWIKHNANSVDDSVVKCTFVFFVFFIFHSDRYVSSIAQHQNNKISCGLWNWNYGKKDITALNAILLQCQFQCLLWYLHVCILQAKSTASRDSTWEEVDMCAGSVRLIQLLLINDIST